MKIALVFMLVFVFLSPAITQAQNNKIVRICMESWPPAQIILAENSGKKGFIIDILSDAFKEKGYQIMIDEMSYLRAISETEKGNCDIAPGVPPGVSKKGIYSKTPVYESQYVIFFNNKKQFSYRGAESLNGLKVATVVGYDYSTIDPKYESFLQNKKNQISVFTGDTAVQKALESIALGNVDVFSEDYVIGSYIIKKINKQNEISATKPFGNVLLNYPLFNPKNIKKSNNLIAIYEAKMKEIKANKMYDQYLKKYDVRMFKE